MDTPLGQVWVWIATTNDSKFTIEAETLDQAADMFQEKMGYYPQPWQLELMERTGDIPTELPEAS